MSREAWHYRFGGRFHPATRQCFFYPLARLYGESTPENPYAGNPEVLQSIRTILAFTVSLQNRDGSFPEWHRGQSSYCSTAYLSAYLSETLLRLRRDLDAPIRESIARSLDAAAGRLDRPPSGIPSNQLAAGILALRNCTALLGGSWNRATLALAEDGSRNTVARTSGTRR